MTSRWFWCAVAPMACITFHRNPFSWTIVIAAICPTTLPVFLQRLFCCCFFFVRIYNNLCKLQHSGCYLPNSATAWLMLWMARIERTLSMTFFRHCFDSASVLSIHALTTRLMTLGSMDLICSCGLKWIRDTNRTISWYSQTHTHTPHWVPIEEKTRTWIWPPTTAALVQSSNFAD